MPVFSILLSLIAGLSALGVVFSRQVVHSALCLTVNLLSVGLLYLSMGLQFLGMAQLLIYAGAIMVVFLFAVTVLSPDEEKDLHTANLHLFAGVGAAAALGAALGVTAWTNHQITIGNTPPGTVHEFADGLFHKFVFPFEATAFLLLVALFGAVLLGHRRLKASGIPTQPPRPSPLDQGGVTHG
jgi:NADH-quinone oxidoreductase subunit J